MVRDRAGIIGGGMMALRTIPIERYCTPDAVLDEFRRDVARGLTSNPKRLQPKWFYDEAGSELFEAITMLDEYYPTRREREILRSRATEIAMLAPARTLIELGSGSSEKTTLLLDALQPSTFVAFDVCESAIVEAGDRLDARYPSIALRGVVGDFEHDLDCIPDDEARMVAFLGGTIGNLTPGGRARFFSAVAAALRPGEWLLLGADLVKDPRRLVAAYDDSLGVTAEFNMNLLRRINLELDGEFDVSRFSHIARWDADNEWMDIRLRAHHAHDVAIPGADIVAQFDEGEEIRTEISAKFRRQGLAAEVARAGFAQAGWWTDPAGDFSLSLWQRT